MARICVIVSNDLVTDQRVSKTCSSLSSWGHHIQLWGRHQKVESPLAARPYPCYRMRMLFHRGPLFYAEFNLRLFFVLLFGSYDIIYANDLDTLFPAVLVSKIRRKKLIYDSHEYFTGVPELVHRPFIQKCWKAIERFCLHRITEMITVNDSIANLFREEYGIKVGVLRNLPLAGINIDSKSRKQLNLPEDKFILILQGNGINVQRGAEEAVEMMKYLPEMLLLIAGSGDVIPALKQQVDRENLGDRVWFLPRMHYAQLMSYTAVCDLGLTLDKDTNINYRFSLPNKLFDYLRAGIPVLASALPEVQRIVETFRVGEVCASHNPSELASSVCKIQSKGTAEYTANIQHALSQLNWEKEVEILKEFI